jgi:hypothetical protein
LLEIRETHFARNASFRLTVIVAKATHVACPGLDRFAAGALGFVTRADHTSERAGAIRICGASRGWVGVSDFNLDVATGDQCNRQATKNEVSRSSHS